MSEIRITRNDLINTILDDNDIVIEINDDNNHELPLYFSKNGVQWKIDLSSEIGFEDGLSIFYYNIANEVWTEKTRIDSDI